MAEQLPPEDPFYQQEKAGETPSPLDYAHGKCPRESTSSSVGAQVVLGFMLWIAALSVAFEIFTTQKDFKEDMRHAVSIAFAALGVTFGVSLLISLKLRWPGFIPGVLIGFGLTCLVPIWINAALCGNHGPP